MNRKLWLISKRIIMIGICLTLIGAMTVTAQAKLPMQQIPQQESQLAGVIDNEVQAGGTITGTVTCLGFISEATNEVFVDLHFDSPQSIPDPSIHIACNQPYQFTGVPDGTYYIGAWLDENDSGDGPPDPGEPHEYFGAPDPIVISSATPTHTDIDLELYRYVERVSLFEGGEEDPLDEENWDSVEPSISGDGRYVVFYSEEDVQNVGSVNRGVHIFDRELDTETSFGATGYLDRFSEPDISADGIYVAATYYYHPDEDDPIARLFIKEWANEDGIPIIIEPLVATDYFGFGAPSISGNGCRTAFEFTTQTPEVTNVHLYDCITEDISLISGTEADSNVPGNSSSYDPAISDDGLFVAFKSQATDLVDPPLTENEPRIYVRDIAAETTELIPFPDGVTEGSFNSAPSISGDGRLVAYQLDYDIYIYDRDTKESIMIPKIDSEITEDNYNPSVSGDGRFVAYESDRYIEEVGWFYDIVVYDLDSGKFKVATKGFDGMVDYYTEYPVISADGRFVAFQSEASDLVVDDKNGTRDVFVYANEPSLTVDIIGAGSVDIDPDKSTYNLGETVTLTPVPDEGYAFDDWTRADAADLVDKGDGTWSIEMDEDKSLTANFVQQFTLTVDVSPTASGTVTLVPDQAMHKIGTLVTLEPIAAADYIFDGWTGTDAAELVDNLDGTWSITMNDDKSLTANFVQQFTLTVDVSPTASGTVTLTPDLTEYSDGTLVTLEPTAATGYIFDDWTGADVADLVDKGDGTWSITMDDDKSLIANFKIAAIYIYLPMILR